MQREPGYYWVKFEGKWRIAEYDSMDVKGELMFWFLSGTDDFLKNEDFNIINENRIISPDEEKERLAKYD